jgi:hypothetical protein
MIGMIGSRSFGASPESQDFLIPKQPSSRCNGHCFCAAVSYVRG